MKAFKRPTIPPLPTFRSNSSLHRRISLDKSTATQRSRISPASVRTDSPASRSGSLLPSENTHIQTEITTQLMRQHMKIGNKVGFKVMSGAAKVTRSRLLESKCGRVLMELREKERRENRLPPSLLTENHDLSRNFPLRSVLSLRNKADLRLNSTREHKTSLKRLFQEGDGR